MAILTTKNKSGIQDYRLVYKNVTVYAAKDGGGDWNLYEDNSFDGRDNGCCCNGRQTLKQCKEDLIYAVDFENYTN